MRVERTTCYAHYDEENDGNPIALQWKTVANLVTTIEVECYYQQPNTDTKALIDAVHHKLCNTRLQRAQELPTIIYFSMHCPKNNKLESKS